MLENTIVSNIPDDSSMVEETIIKE
jgi:hypothetical protein